ncbi:MAG: hypothetical protein AB8B57_11795 [Congregibacter sp.]
MSKRRATAPYLNAADVDQLARQNVQLITELWIVKDRLAVLENLLAEKGVLTGDEVDAATPNEQLEATLDAERESYIKRILGLPEEYRTAENLKALAVKR